MQSVKELLLEVGNRVHLAAHSFNNSCQNGVEKHAKEGTLQTVGGVFAVENTIFSIELLSVSAALIDQEPGKHYDTAADSLNALVYPQNKQSEG